MTNEAPNKNAKYEASRKAWSAPKVREIVPVRRTYGGGNNRNDQDDTFYDLS